jgi:hypothetical protein
LLLLLKGEVGSLASVKLLLRSWNQKARVISRRGLERAKASGGD